MNLLSLILTLGLISGQLIRITISTGGITLLDLIIIAFCIIGFIKLKGSLGKPPKFIIAALVFALVGTVSLIFTPLHLNSNEILTSFSYTLRFLIYIIFVWLIYLNTFPGFKDKITNSFITSGIILAILGVLQIIFIPNLMFLAAWGWDPHYFRTVSTFLDPNFIGAFFVLTLLLLASTKQKIKSKKFISSVFVVYIALLTTFSRSSYLMFLFSGLTFSIFKKSKKLIISTIILFLVLLLGFQIYSQAVARPRGIDRGQSASFRIDTWQQGISLFKKSPIIGIGFNSYRYGIKEFNLGDDQFLQSHGASTNDSSLLYILSTTGVVGLISYLSFIYFLVRSRTKKNIILIAALVGLSIHSIFANSFFYPFILLWVLLKGVDKEN